MFKAIPWDVWLAAGLAAGVALVALFDLWPAAFIVIYISLCVYIVVQVIGDEVS